MNVFKLSVDSPIVYKITDRNDFELLTRKLPPWVSFEFTDSGRRLQHYAVCPHCKNTIVFIGFNTGTKVKSPYGKHYLSRSIPGLGFRNQDAYDVCPYHEKRKPTPLTKSDKFPDDYDLYAPKVKRLIEYFDVVIEMLESLVGVKLSKRCLKNMLEAYKASQGWLYKGASEENLPLSFAYLTGSESIYGQTFVNLDIRDALISENDGLYFVNNRLVPKVGVFFSAAFSFLDHQRKVTNHQLTESLAFTITKKGRKDIYQKVISMGIEDFSARIENLSEEDRRMDLVDLAKQELGYLLRASRCASS